MRTKWIGEARRRQMRSNYLAMVHRSRAKSLISKEEKNPKKVEKPVDR